MPRYNVHDPETGKWRCFSSVTDDWITDWMSQRDYQEWRYKEYGRGCGPIFRANIMDLDEAERRIQERESWEH